VSTELLVTVILFAEGLLLGAFGFLVKWLLERYQQHIDKRFDQIDAETKRALQDVNGLRRELNELRSSLPLQYIQREDWIRFSTTIDTKIDAIHRKLDERVEQLRLGIERLNDVIHARNRS
jgi:chromosome segregation ATPase